MLLSLLMFLVGLMIVVSAAAGWIVTKSTTVPIQPSPTAVAPSASSVPDVTVTASAPPPPTFSAIANMFMSFSASSVSGTCPTVPAPMSIAGTPSTGYPLMMSNGDFVISSASLPDDYYRMYYAGQYPVTATVIAQVNVVNVQNEDAFLYLGVNTHDAGSQVTALNGSNYAPADITISNVTINPGDFVGLFTSSATGTSLLAIRVVNITISYASIPPPSPVEKFSNLQMVLPVPTSGNCPMLPTIIPFAINNGPSASGYPLVSGMSNGDFKTTAVPADKYRTDYVGVQSLTATIRAQLDVIDVQNEPAIVYLGVNSPDLVHAVTIPVSTTGPINVFLPDVTINTNDFVGLYMSSTNGTAVLVLSMGVITVEYT